MLNLDNFKGIYLYKGYVDFRKSINGLVSIVESEMKLNLFEAHLFIFCNQTRKRLKILYWDATGFALWYKRLEKERFIWPKKHQEEVIKIEADSLRWLLSGIDIWQIKKHKKLEYSYVF